MLKRFCIVLFALATAIAVTSCVGEPASSIEPTDTSAPPSTEPIATPSVVPTPSASPTSLPSPTAAPEPISCEEYFNEARRWEPIGIDDSTANLYSFIYDPQDELQLKYMRGVDKVDGGAYVYCNNEGNSYLLAEHADSITQGHDFIWWSDGGSVYRASARDIENGEKEKLFSSEMERITDLHTNGVLLYMIGDLKLCRFYIPEARLDIFESTEFDEARQRFEVVTTVEVFWIRDIPFNDNPYAEWMDYSSAMVFYNLRKDAMYVRYLGDRYAPGMDEGKPVWWYNLLENPELTPDYVME